MELSKMMQTIREVTSNVLETMFFQVVEVIDSKQTIGGWFPQDKQLIWTRLNFRGPVEGSFCFIISGEDAAAITANFLGLELEEIENVQRDDTVKEILNMIGGGTLSKLDKSGAFKLEVPELVDGADFQSATMDGESKEFIFIETDHSRSVAGVVLAPSRQRQ